MCRRAFRDATLPLRLSRPPARRPVARAAVAPTAGRTPRGCFPDRQSGIARGGGCARRPHGGAGAELRAGDRRRPADSWSRFCLTGRRRLGQPRFVPLGYSRKFWYDDALSVPISSITTPEAGRRLRLDPNLLPLIRGRRVIVVDDAVSTGTTVVAALRLLRAIDVEAVGMVVAMKQTNRWETVLRSAGCACAAGARRLRLSVLRASR